MINRERSMLMKLDHLMIESMRRFAMPILRVALGTVFVWFGALKILNVSPIAGFVSDSLPFLPARFAVVSMGILEVVIGMGLLTGFAIRIALLLFFAQMLGTLSTLVFQSGDVFQKGNPFLLTTLGEFVIKNLVLIAAGLAIVASVQKARSDDVGTDLLTARPQSEVRPPADWTLATPTPSI